MDLVSQPRQSHPATTRHFHLVESALGLKVYRSVATEDQLPAVFLADRQADVKTILNSEHGRGVKVALALQIGTERLRLEGGEQENWWERTSQHRVFNDNFDVKPLLEELLTKVDDREQRGSGWGLVGVRQMTVEIVPYHAHRGSSYISTPKSLHTRSIVNVVNNDQGGTGRS
jgi:hypothetical protein